MDIRRTLLRLVKGKNSGDSPTSSEGASLGVGSVVHDPAVPPEHHNPEAPVTLRDVQWVALKVMDVLEEKQKRERRSRRWRWVAVLTGVALLAFIFLGAPPSPQEPQVTMGGKPRAVIPLDPSKKGIAHVALIPIMGVIDGDETGPPGFDNTPVYIRTALKLATEQENLAAIIFSIDSGGGGAVASAQGYQLIRDFREKTKVPVYAYVSSEAYSGGYYLALGANKIIVGPHATVGSVGVIIRYFNTAKIGEVLGLGEVEIVTGSQKSCLSQWKHLSSSCKKMIQRSVDLTFEEFLRAMSDSRNIPFETLLAESKTETGRTNGSIYAAKDAVGSGMADMSMKHGELYKFVAKEVATKNHDFKQVEFVDYYKKVGKLDEWISKGEKPLQSLSRLMDALSGAALPRMELRAE